MGTSATGVPLTLTGAFEEQARRAPDAPAITEGERTLSYAALDREADRLAGRLSALAIEPATIVALYLDRSIDAVVAMLAVLRIGCAYLPIDPLYPGERVSYMVDDCRAAAVLTSRALVERFPTTDAAVLCVDDSQLANDATRTPERTARHDGLAYVIYTSGSTGRPKGTMVTHRNVLRLFDATSEFGLSSTDVVSFFHSCAFDFSVWEIWGALLFGGRLVVIDRETTRDPVRFAQTLSREGVTVVSQTPSAFAGLAETDTPLPAVRLVVLGGEAMRPASVRRWWARRGVAASIVNMYGITETTVHVTSCPLDPTTELDGPYTPIGRPLPDLEVHLLDGELRPVAADVVGEMYVGGPGVTRGYLGRPGLTASRYVPNAYGEGRLYRTGDLATRRVDGTLWFAGRADQQVKIRGFRVEPREIEAAIEDHPGVETAAVVPLRASTGLERTLAAFVVPSESEAGPVRRLKSLERRGRLEGVSLCDLPNGATVAFRNRGEVEFVYDEIFDRQTYFKNGICADGLGCVFDVGANIGLFSLAVAERSPDAVIYAFEPIAETFELLRLNAEIHCLRGTSVACALGAEDGETTISFFPHDTIFSGLHAGREERAIVHALLRQQSDGVGAGLLEELLDERMVTRELRCRLRMLSSVIEEYGVEEIDLLKFDVEKGEWDLFAGIRDSDWPRIRQVVGEVHGDSAHAGRVAALLETKGFAVVVQEDDLLTGVGLHNVYATRGVNESRPIARPAGRWGSEAALVRDIRERLQRRLPEFMLPSRYVVTDQLPLTENGKIERDALEGGASIRVTTPAPPPSSTPNERLLCVLVADVLQIGDVEPDDNFFEIGGDSLRAIQLVRRVHETFGVKLRVGHLFDNPVVSELAAFLPPPPSD